MDKERDILLGVVGATLGFIDPSELQKSGLAHTLAGGGDPVAKTPGLAETMVSSGVLAPKKRAILERMVDETLAACDGDFEEAVELFGGNAALSATFGGELTLDAALISASDSSTRGKRIAMASDEQTLLVTAEHPQRYAEQGELGRGGIGRVVLVNDTHLGRDIAMKELLPSRAGTSVDTPARLSTPVVRFLREARVTGQLEHPNIVPVYELGKRTDGSLYYTMKIVRGRTLSEVLEESSTLAERLALLPHFAQACQAIAYAHHRGVVHRDLKPDNIMIGEFGETMVLDWGLAKASGEDDLREKDLAADAERLRGMQSSQTMDGQLLGTPLYMSPEQANGEIASIGPPSDVWSLGAILYEILTGQQAFHAESLLRVVERVTEARYTPVRELAGNAPPELIAVCEKALTLNRDQRFSNAEPLADEIEAYMGGQRLVTYSYSFSDLVKRWARKHRAVFAVSTAAVVLLAALGISSLMHIRQERDRAVAAEKVATDAEGRASQERDRAEFLVHFMLTTLKDELSPIGRLELLNSVVDAILKYYDELGLDRTRAQHQMARALNISAEVQMSRGEVDAASTSLERAARLLESLREREPGNIAVRLDLGQNHLVRARLHLARGDAQRAEPAIEKARAVFAPLHERFPDEPQAAQGLADVTMLLAQRARLERDLNTARAHFESALALRKDLERAAPEDLERVHDLAEAYERLGEVHFEAGRLGEAQQVYDEAVILRDRLALAEKDHAIWLEAMAALHHQVGQLYEQRGAYDDALAAYRESYHILTALVGRDPTNVAWRQGRAQRLLAVGDLFQVRGRKKTAHRTLVRARDAFRTLLEIDPDHRLWKRDLALSQVLLGQLALQREQTSDAVEALTDAVTQLESLSEDPELRRDLSVALNLLARAQQQSGELDRALATHARGFELLAALTRVEESPLDWKRDLALAHITRARLLRQKGDTKASQAALEEALAVMDGLLERDPENALWKRDRGQLVARLGLKREQGATTDRDEPEEETEEPPTSISDRFAAPEIRMEPRLRRSDSRVRWRVVDDKPVKAKGHKRRFLIKSLETLDANPLEADDF